MVNQKNLKRLQERQPLYASCISAFAQKKIEALHSKKEPSPTIKNFMDVLYEYNILDGYETLEQDLKELIQICG